MSEPRTWPWVVDGVEQQLTAKQIRALHTTYSLDIIAKRCGAGLRSLAEFHTQDRASQARQQAARKRSARILDSMISAGIRTESERRAGGKRDIRPYFKGE